MLSGKELHQVQNGLDALINPGGNIRQLEARVRFADIDLYETCLTGVFDENEHVLLQLIEAYSRLQAYPEVIAAARKLYQRPQFARSRQHMLYALALEATGDTAAAEAEFKKMSARFSHFEARYQFGQFLLRNQRQPEGARLYRDMIDEADQLRSRERSAYRLWISQAKVALRSM